MNFYMYAFLLCVCPTIVTAWRNCWWMNYRGHVHSLQKRTLFRWTASLAFQGNLPDHIGAP